MLKILITIVAAVFLWVIGYSTYKLINNSTNNQTSKKKRK